MKIQRVAFSKLFWRNIDEFANIMNGNLSYQKLQKIREEFDVFFQCAFLQSTLCFNLYYCSEH